MSKRHEDRALKLHARLTAGMRMHGGSGPKKYMTAEVDSLGVSVDSKGAMTVSFTYEDGTGSEIEFAPEATIYDMAAEAKKHARGRCSEIREARENAKAANNRQADRDRERAARDAAYRARVADLAPLGESAKPGDVVAFAPGDGAEYGHAEVVTEEQAAAYNAAKPSIRDDARAYAARRAAEEGLSLTERADAARADLRARIAEALAKHHAENPRNVMRDGVFGGSIECPACDFESFAPDGFDMGSKDDDLIRAFAEHQADVVLDLL